MSARIANGNGSGCWVAGSRADAEFCCGNGLRPRNRLAVLTGKFATVAAFALGSLLMSGVASAQTFNGNIVNTAGNSAIPSAGTGGCGVAPQTTGGTIFNNVVAGLPPDARVTEMRVNFTHTFTSDIDMYLVAPNGQTLELSSDNGGAGDNFTNTVFRDGAPSITTGVPPYTGTFSAEGSLAAPNCGTPVATITNLAGFATGQNGTWRLVIQDDAGADVGTMLAWSISFVGTQGIPTLSEWAMVVLTLLLAFGAWIAMRRRAGDPGL